MRRYPTPTGTARRQRGVVLAMSLIFLAILSLVGLYAMRGSIQGEQVSKNLRSSEVATQAAETALRFCEDRVRTGQPLTILETPVTLTPGEDPRAVSFMRPHLITAVGFSADYERDASNRAISGGEVWLQTVLIP